MFPNSPYAHPAGAFTVPVTPPGVDPREGPLTSVSVNCEWLPLIRGALTQLLLQSTWDTDTAGLGVVQSQVARLISLFGEVDCNVCECIEYIAGVPQKFVPDGHGGGSFVQVDPRNDGTVPPPWPTPPAGQTGNCLGAANNAKTFQNSMDLIVNALGGAALFATIVITITDLFGLVLPVWGAAFAIITNWAVEAADAGAAVMAAAFQGADPNTVYDQISCIISCHIAADGRVTQDAIDSIKADFAAYLPTSPESVPQQDLWLFFFNGWLDNQGPNGLTLLGRSANIIAHDCSICSCGWCYPYNFLTSDEGFTAEAYAPESSITTWVAGHGFVGQTTNITEAAVAEAGLTGTMVGHVSTLDIKAQAFGYTGGSCILGVFLWEDNEGGTGVQLTSVAADGTEQLIHIVVNADVTNWHFMANLDCVGQPLTARIELHSAVIRGTGTPPHGPSAC